MPDKQATSPGYCVHTKMAQYIPFSAATKPHAACNLNQLKMYLLEGLMKPSLKHAEICFLSGGSEGGHLMFVLARIRKCQDDCILSSTDPSSDLRGETPH